MLQAVSNEITMKKVSYRIKNEIEYLGALAEMYEHESNATARDAALNAIDALKRLAETLDGQNLGLTDEFPCAA
jgi:two-component sensor histidine kinase